ncbi:peptide ABC transporter substrate-binding protein [Alkalihalophilus pseudofirmus]|nr:peptide ABC transporter substrate-binding protein [Alkalihalophilus pseudofirmus]
MLKKALLTLLLLTALSLIAACSSEGVEGSGDGGTLIIGIESEADVLDPHRAGGWVTFRINRQIHESLVTGDLSDPNQMYPPIKPGLAEAWDISDDGLTYTFHLREGVKFHDGTDFNAEAVDFNVRRAWDPDFEYYDANSAGNLSLVYERVKDIRVEDEYTFVFEFDEPFSAFLSLLTQGGMGSTGILSPTALMETGNDQYAENPVGTGPFKFETRERGQRIELVRNEDYWGEKPHIDGVIFRPIPDGSARVLALESGEVDIIAVPTPDSVERLVDSGFKLEQSAPPHSWYLNFNFDHPAISDLRVRQAIIMAIDREGMANDLLRGTATPSTSAQTPANSAFDPDFVDYEYNPEKAKELLEEAGYGDGFQVKFQTSIDGSGQLIPVPMAEWIQADLAKVGIDVILDTYEWITYLGFWTTMDPDVGFNQMSWGMSTPYFISIIGSENGIGNAGNYYNPEFDELVHKAITELDPEVADEYWKQANQILAEDAAFAPIVNDTAPYVMADYVEGFIAPNEEWYDLIDVTIN